MNIFYLDDSVTENAKAHCDKHVIKMMIEHCQLMSLAVWHYEPEMARELKARDLIYCEPKPGRMPAHFNHPSAIWVRENRGHFDYLKALTLLLGQEYYIRYGYLRGKNHASLAVAEALESTRNFPSTVWRPPPQCVPDQYKCDSTVDAYRNYYLGEKMDFVTYTNRPTPRWVCTRSW